VAAVEAEATKLIPLRQSNFYHTKGETPERVSFQSIVVFPLYAIKTHLSLYLTTAGASGVVV
jgi:hypothetical protein